MRVIMLTGGNSCGKTTTLNMVYQMLLSNQGISTKRQPLGGNPNDFSDIVLFHQQRIAFFTMGDYSGDVVNAMIDYSNQEVAVLVCACNNRFVRPFTKIQNYSHTIIPKTLASENITEQTANTADVNQIFSLI